MLLTSEVKKYGEMVVFRRNPKLFYVSSSTTTLSTRVSLKIKNIVLSLGDFTPSAFMHRPDICHEYHELYLWRKNCCVEKFQLSMYDNCGEIENFSTCGEISVQLLGFIAIFAVLLLNLLFTLFCREIFATIYPLS